MNIPDTVPGDELTVEELTLEAHMQGRDLAAATRARDEMTADVDNRRERLTDLAARIAVKRVGVDPAAAVPFTYPGLGTVTYYPATGERRIGVANHTEFREHLAQHHPAGVRALIEVPADQLETALVALDAAGIGKEQGRTAELVDVPHAQAAYLKTVEVVESTSSDGKREFDFFGPEGLEVPGLDMVRGKKAQLRVITDKEA